MFVSNFVSFRFCSVLQKKIVTVFVRYYKKLLQFFPFVLYLLQAIQISVSVRYYKKKKIVSVFFFRFCIIFVTAFRFCSVLQKKKNLLQFFFGITKNCYSFFRLYYICYRLFKSLFLFGIKKKKICFSFFFLSFLYYIRYSFSFLFGITKNCCSFFFSVCIIFVTEMVSPSTPVNPIPNHGEKPEMFNGTDFKRWKQKMLFYLTTLNLARFLNEDGPKLDVGETNKDKLAAVDAWNHSDFLCRNYVLNGLENTLYNIYSPLKKVKELWDSLDKKYKTVDAGL